MERISLANDHLEGANNVYLFDSGPETVLVDTGSPDKEALLLDALDEYGVTFEDIDEVFLTHGHPDHSGLAGRIHEASGAPIRIHRDGARMTADDEEMEAFAGELEARLASWGVPPAKREELFANRAEVEDESGPAVPPTTAFADGDEFDVGEYTLEVRHTPGHSAGSVCFLLHDPSNPDESPREILAGDTLLPNYTPNVGGPDVRLDRPLERYLDSLGWLIEADFDRAWPGHSEPIEDPTARAHEIVAHHEERAERVLEVLERTGPADVWTVATELFGDLAAFHIVAGAGEAYAHMDHLAREGVLERDDGTYRLADSRTPGDAADDTASVLGVTRSGYPDGC